MTNKEVLALVDNLEKDLEGKNYVGVFLDGYPHIDHAKFLQRVPSIIRQLIFDMETKNVM